MTDMERMFSGAKFFSIKTYTWCVSNIFFKSEQLFLTLMQVTGFSHVQIGARVHSMSWYVCLFNSIEEVL